MMGASLLTDNCNVLANAMMNIKSAVGTLEGRGIDYCSQKGSLKDESFELYPKDRAYVF